MKGNPTYDAWQKGIARARYEFEEWEDKYIRLGRDTYMALKYEIMHMPAEEVASLPADLQSWVRQLRPELEGLHTILPHDKVTLDLCLVSDASEINWEAEPYVFVPVEADDALRTVFDSLRETGGRDFYIKPSLENQVCGELQGKIISVPLPLKEATQYLELTRALAKIFSDHEGIEAIKVEVAKLRRLEHQ